MTYLTYLWAPIYGRWLSSKATPTAAQVKNDRETKPSRLIPARFCPVLSSFSLPREQDLGGYGLEQSIKAQP